MENNVTGVGAVGLQGEVGGGNIVSGAFRCSLKDLKRALKVLAPLLKSTSYPILRGMRIEVNEDSVVLYRTTLECGIGMMLRAEGSLPGSFVVDAKKLQEVAQSVKGREGDTIFFRAEKESVYITADGVTFSLPLLDAEGDYPATIQGKPEKVLWRGQLGDLARASELVEFAALSQSEARRGGNPVLTETLLEFAPPSLHIVATNGYRMGIKMFDGIDTQDRFTVPTDFFRIVLKILSIMKNKECNVLLARDEERMYGSIGDGGCWCWGRLGRDYPTWQAVVPDRTTASSIVVNREALQAAIEKVSVLAEDGGIIFENHGSDMLKLSTETNQSEALIPVESLSYTGKIKMKAEYLQDVLKRLESEKVKLYIHDPERAVIVEPEGNLPAPQDAGYMYILMPIRLS